MKHAINMKGEMPSALMGTIGILGMEGYIPEKVIETSFLTSRFEGVSVEHVRKKISISHRRWATDNEKPSDMAHTAGCRALDSSGISATELGGIIVATTTPDVCMPSTACLLMSKLGLSGIPAFDLNAACSGWLYGIVVAESMVAEGLATHIMVVGVEIQSRLLDQSDMSTLLLFGDGAGATIVSGNASGRIIRSRYITADTRGMAIVRRSLPGYTIRSVGNEYDHDPYIRYDAESFIHLATESFTQVIENAIRNSGWKPDEVRWVILHRSDVAIAKAVSDKCGIPVEKFYCDIDHFGDVGSATIPLLLKKLGPTLVCGDRLILCGFGSGAVAASICIEW